MTHHIDPNMIFGNGDGSEKKIEIELEEIRQNTLRTCTWEGHTLVNYETPWLVGRKISYRFFGINAFHNERR